MLNYLLQLLCLLNSYQQVEFIHNLVLNQWIFMVKISFFLFVDWKYFILAFTSIYQLICIIIYMIIILYFMWIEIHLLFELKWKYFYRFWSLIEVGIIICSWSSVWIYIWRYKESQRISQLFEETNGYVYINLQLASYVNDILTFFINIETLKYQCLIDALMLLKRLCKFDFLRVDLNLKRLYCFHTKRLNLSLCFFVTLNSLFFLINLDSFSDILFFQLKPHKDFNIKRSSKKLKTWVFLYSNKVLILNLFLLIFLVFAFSCFLG